jgi:hypothetical protein
MTFLWKFYVIFVPERHFCGVAQDQPDSDTGTTFISFENEYIALSGDDTTLGGRETVRILRGASFSDNSMEFKHNDLNGLLVVSHSGRL